MLSLRGKDKSKNGFRELEKRFANELLAFCDERVYTFELEPWEVKALGIAEKVVAIVPFLGDSPLQRIHIWDTPLQLVFRTDEQLERFIDHAPSILLPKVYNEG